MKARLSDYRRIFSDLKTGEPAPVYLFTGEEYFIMEEMASRLVGRYVSEDMKSFNLEVEYGSEIDMEAFISTARSFPFISEKRLMVLKELERLKGRWKSLLDYCGSPADSTIMVLLFHSGGPAGGKTRPPKDYRKLEKTIEGTGKVFRCGRLDDRELAGWLISKASRMGFEMTEEGVAALMDSVGTDLHDLQNELEKLSVLYEGGTAGREEVASIIGRYRLSAVSDLISALGSRKEGKALEILAGIINTGAERPSVVLYHLIRHFLALLRVRAGQEGGGYRQEMLRREADRRGTRDIIVWLENLRVAELLMKSTSFPERLVVENAVLHSIKGRLTEPRAASAA